MNPTLGTNAVKFPNEGGSLQDIQARIKAFENPAPAEPTPPPVSEPVATPPVADQLPAEATPPAPPAEATTVEVPQQFKDKEGKLDEDKIQKSNEHLRKGIEDRQAKILKLNKELREKFRESGTTLNQEKAKAQAEEALGDIPRGQLTPEQKAKIAEEIQKDPIEGMIALQRIIAKQEMEPHVGTLRSIVEDRSESSQLKELDRLIVEEGHDWILSEGPARFEAAFKERPWLRQSATPYADALRFMDVPGQQPTVAQVGPKTPILGAARAVPPPSPVPTVTPDQHLADLSNALHAAIRNKDFKTAGELEAKMDAAYKGRFQ